MSKRTEKVQDPRLQVISKELNYDVQPADRYIISINKIFGEIREEAFQALCKTEFIQRKS